MDYDADDDGLIEVADLAQLHAIRWDLDGDGTSANAGYADAFPDAAAAMGCPASGCTGYELTADLDFDTDGSGTVDANDAYWDNGAGWLPLGSNDRRFRATFDGNGHRIANLRIARSRDHVGLFGVTAAGSTVRHVGLPGAQVTGAAYVGGLVGWHEGDLTGVFVSGAVTGTVVDVGGLVGWNSGRITTSYATAAVVGGRDAGGLVGANGQYGRITASYASGAVTGTGRTGGLTAFTAGQITATYARGVVTGTGTDSGGLVSLNIGTVTASYWDTTTSGQTTSASGVGQPTSELQTPTGYTGIYATWNVNVDGASGNDDPWDFGTASQYPVLQLDVTGDGTVSWEEFGPQRAPAAPANLATVPAATSVALTWDAVTGAVRYEVEVLASGAASWTSDADELTDATHTVVELRCGTSYEFRVRAYGDGVTHAAAWGVAAAPVTAATTACAAPVFDMASYRFTVLAGAAVDTLVGTVAATAADGATVSYTITAGNAAGAFAIDGVSGALTVAGTLDAAGYTLTVSATDATGTSATVTVTVTRVPAVTVAFAQAGYTAEEGAASGVTVTVSLGVAPEREVTIPLLVTYDGGAEAADVSGVPASVTLAADATAASFEVVAVDDAVDDAGESVTLSFGTLPAGVTAGGVATTTVSLTDNDGAAPPAPVFEMASYRFTVLEDAAVDTAVGTVAATAADGAAVSYAISAGNEAGTFAIDATTGAITVAAALDYLITEAYTLTVTATSTAGTTDVTVTIAVTGVDCANGTVIANPGSHAALVADCGVLLAAQATLAGDGTLNWSEGLALAQWDGVATGGTPTRVTGLDVSDKSLDGTIPSTLGTLTALTTLDLSANALTGAVPSELSALTSLTTLGLSGNPLSGCVPAAIRPLAAAITAAGGTHDITELSLPYCDAHAPVPTGVAAAATSATGVTVSWDGATDVGTLTYRVEYRRGRFDRRLDRRRGGRHRDDARGGRPDLRDEVCVPGERQGRRCGLAEPVELALGHRHRRPVDRRRRHHDQGRRELCHRDLGLRHRL